MSPWGTDKEELQLLSVPGIWEDLGGAALTNMSVPPTRRLR